MSLNRKLNRISRTIAFAALLLVVSAAPAQDSVMQQAGPLAQPISNRTVEMFSSVLKLDAEQKSLVRTLYAGYRANYKQTAAACDMEIEAARKRSGESEGSQRDSRASEVKIAQAFVQKQDEMEKAFVSDLRSLLTPEQTSLFERAERARRREVGFRFTFVSGEGVDLLQVIDKLKVDRDSTPELREATEQYEVEADRAMVAKDKMLRDVFKKIEQLDGPDPDPKEMEKIIGEFFTNGTRVRDVNRQHARKIEPLLPTDKRAAFDREVKKLSFPRVYAESPAEKAIKFAHGLTDLTAEQRTEINTVSETYTREADGANTRWAAAIEDKQSKAGANFLEMMMSGADEKSDDPLKLAREARKALDDRMITRVGQILNAEQREKLPKIEDEPDSHRPEWEPNFDEMEAWQEWKKEDEEPAAAPQPTKDR